MPGFPFIDALFSAESLLTSSALPISPCYVPTRDVVRAMDCSGITHAVLSPCIRAECARHEMCSEAALEEVFQRISAEPLRFSGLSICTTDIDTSVSKLEETVQRFGFRGLYVSAEAVGIPVTEPRLYTPFEMCARLGVVAVLQVGYEKAAMASIEDAAQIAKEFPSLKVLAAVIAPFNLKNLLGLCEKLPNLYFTFDGSLPEPADEMLFRNSGIARERALFGSNGIPWHSSIDAIVSHEFPDDLARAFLYKNASRVFNIELFAKAYDVAS